MDGKELKPGDLIEVYDVVFSHWAVYIGGGNVVHFGTSGIGSGSSTMSASGQKGGVLKEELKEVVGNSNWRINNHLDNQYEPRNPDEIVKEACARVGSTMTYSLTNYNCEHFATELRYGKAECRQVKEVQWELIAIAGAIVAGAAAIAFGLMKN